MSTSPFDPCMDPQERIRLLIAEARREEKLRRTEWLKGIYWGTEWKVRKQEAKETYGNRSETAQ